MFNRARLKLTLWYLLIIMLISISFSMVIFRVLTSEFNRAIKMDKLRQQGINYPPQKTLIFFQNGSDDMARGVMISPPHIEVIDEAKQRLLHILIGINLLILGFSGAAGYFLAGRTLRPIKLMLDEQRRFITDSSHELRTPLTALKSEIEVNLRDKNLTLKDAKKLLGSNLEEVNNLQTLSDNLIKLTQYQRNNNVSFEILNLKTAINDAVKKVNGLIKKKQIVIKNDAVDINVKGDKQCLTEFFVILIDNAVKYSPPKTTVLITAKKSSRRVVTIEVKDQGEGINNEDLPKIFDRFYRADKSRSRTDGLGLSIAKEIIQKHQGSIKAISEKNKGTSFIIQLPLNA